MTRRSKERRTSRFSFSLQSQPVYITNLSLVSTYVPTSSVTSDPEPHRRPALLLRAPGGELGLCGPRTPHGDRHQLLDAA